MMEVQSQEEKAKKPALKAKDFASDQDIKWCPGCGDYAILKQMQSALPEIGIKKEDIVFVSGIGCSSRFPYYMNTFGMHSIHGRATAVAAGLKAARPDLSTWIITGDGDALSIGGNHLIHLLRRNPNVNIMLFNNQIYGLTKGQYSPTSELGKVTKTTPSGSIDHPFNPLSVCLGAGGTFIARAMDRDPKALKQLIIETHQHKGSSLLEIYQNCPIFNDGAFSAFTDKETKKTDTVYLKHGEPLIFGDKSQFGIKLDGITPVIVNLEEEGVEGLWIHDEKDKTKAYILTQLFDDPKLGGHLPRPFGIFYKEDRFCYEDAMQAQVDHDLEIKGEGDLDALLSGNNTWVVD